MPPRGPTPSTSKSDLLLRFSFSLVLPLLRVRVTVRSRRANAPCAQQKRESSTKKARDCDCLPPSVPGTRVPCAFTADRLLRLRSQTLSRAVSSVAAGSYCSEAPNKKRETTRHRAFDYQAAQNVWLSVAFRLVICRFWSAQQKQRSSCALKKRWEAKGQGAFDFMSLWSEMAVVAYLPLNR